MAVVQYTHIDNTHTATQQEHSTMYLSKAQGNAIARAIFEIQLSTEVIAEAKTDEAKLAGFHRRYIAEKALKDLGINVDFFSDTRAVSDKGFQKWWDLKKKHAA